MPLFVHVCADDTLAIPKSRTILVSRWPSVFGATLYNQRQKCRNDIDTEATDTQNCLDTVIQSEVQGAENGQET